MLANIKAPVLLSDKSSTMHFSSRWISNPTRCGSHYSTANTKRNVNEFFVIMSETAGFCLIQQEASLEEKIKGFRKFRALIFLHRTTLGRHHAHDSQWLFVVFLLVTSRSVQQVLETHGRTHPPFNTYLKQKMSPHFSKTLQLSHLKPP